MKKLLAVTAIATLCSPAFAGDYDFSYSNLEHLKGAYQMCEKMGFSGNGPDCPVVYTKCWNAPNIYHSGGHTKTKCKKATSFTGTPEDGDKAISDAKGMISGE